MVECPLTIINDNAVFEALKNVRVSFTFFGAYDMLKKIFDEGELLGKAVLSVWSHGFKQNGQCYYGTS